ncbi:hypothetical protein [Ensifer sp. Root127]|uniref:hypothetical protein n=1 Tax=Ensifer sp. Root127 TaxID=1736440 RepID=UPI000A581459|nr:hypothetical protein [Ensifer sp. Root127]
MLISTAISVVQKGMRVIAISEEQGTNNSSTPSADMINSIGENRFHSPASGDRHAVFR